MEKKEDYDDKIYFDSKGKKLEAIGYRDILKLAVLSNVKDGWVKEGY